MKYSAEQDAHILKRKREDGAFFFEIAEELGPEFTADAVRGRWRTLRKQEAEPAVIVPEPNFNVIRPIVVSPEIRKIPREKQRKVEISVHYSDVHFPYANPQALSILYQVLEDLDPDYVVCHGDLLDCTSISRFEKDPRMRHGLQGEIRQAAEHLALVAKLTPHAERYLIEGNHEDRVRRLVWEMAQEPRVKELLNLPGVMDAMKLETLLGMPSNGWQYHEKKIVFKGKLILKHGTAVRRWSGMTEKEEWMKYGKSGMSGHTHRMAAFNHRDWHGQHAWYGLGCMCELSPDYMEDPDWQNGFAVVTWTEDGRFAVEQVFVHEGRAVFRGREYSG